MIRSRASIATLLVLVGLMGLGLAALRSSSRLWANICFSVVLLALLFAVASIIYRRGPHRAFWVGFSLFGWTYLLIALGPAPFHGWRDWLITTPLLVMAEEQFREVQTPTVTAGRLGTSTSIRQSLRVTGELTPWSYWTDTDRSNRFFSDTFNRIGHCLFCVGIAMGGGVVCCFLSNSRDEASPPP